MRVYNYFVTRENIILITTIYKWMKVIVKLLAVGQILRDYSSVIGFY